LLPKAGPPPPVLIDQVIVDGQAAPMSGRLEIPPGRHRVEFCFSAISFSAPDKVRLRHCLQGADAGWVATNSARAASYTNLLPGTYTMAVSACHEDGVWNEQAATFVVTIIPYWWQTTWFRGGALCLLIGSVALTVRFLSELKLRRRLKLLEQEHALEKERARIARDVHDELGSSVTGLRFIIRRLTEENSDRERGRVIEQLNSHSRRLAFDLERVVWSVSPKNNSLDRLASYVGSFSRNFLRGGSIECLFECSSVIPKLTVPPDIQHHVLSLTREAVNNVQKHSRATQVVVRTEYVDGLFKIHIRDNGVGFNLDAPENAERNGLENMRSRVAEMRGQISVESSPGHGTDVRVAVPINTLLENGLTSAWF
jgi:signal transduction histidine kinase